MKTLDLRYDSLKSFKAAKKLDKVRDQIREVYDNQLAKIAAIKFRNLKKMAKLQALLADVEFCATLDWKSDFDSQLLPLVMPK